VEDSNGGLFVFPEGLFVFPNDRFVLPERLFVFPNDRFVLPEGLFVFPNDRFVFPENWGKKVNGCSALSIFRVWHIDGFIRFPLVFFASVPR
jgi:hypothetical protein